MARDGIFDVGGRSTSTRALSTRISSRQNVCRRRAAPRPWSIATMIVSATLCCSLMMDRAAATPFKPPWLSICHRSEAKLDECLKTSINQIIKALRNGEADFGISSLDPIELPFIQLDRVATTNITLRLEHSLITGLGDISVVTVKPNLEDRKLEMALKCPNVTSEGYFTSEGGILTYPFVSQGDYSINIQDITGMCIIYFGQVESTNTLIVDKMYVDVMSTSVVYHFGEQLNGDSELSVQANKFFNENALELFKIVKPNIVRGLTQVFTTITDQVLASFPEDMLFPP